MEYICIPDSNLTESSKIEILSQGKSIIRNLEELYNKLVIDDFHKIFITKVFFDEYFNSISFSRFYKEYQKYNKKIEIKVEHLTEDEFYSFTFLKDKILPITDVNLFISLLMKEPNIFNEIKKSIETDVKIEDEVLENSSLINHLKQSLKQEQFKAAALELQLGEERERNAHIVSAYRDLIQRINLNKKGYIEHSNRPYTVSHSFSKVLYLKEWSRVQYVDSLLKYLRSIIMSKYNISVRVLVMEPAMANSKAKTYEYCVPDYNLTLKDIIGSNIVMSGYNIDLMKRIMENGSQVPLLIVLDRTQTDFISVEGDNVEVIYISSDYKDLKDKERSRIISYSKDTLQIPYYEGFDNLSETEKLRAYSSFSTVSKLVELVERS